MDYIQCDGSTEIVIDVSITKGSLQTRTYSTPNYEYIEEDYRVLTVYCNPAPIEDLNVYYEYEQAITFDRTSSPLDSEYNRGVTYITIPAGQTSVTRDIYYYREYCLGGDDNLLVKQE